jgi:hypothetical protein
MFGGLVQDDSPKHASPHFFIQTLIFRIFKYIPLNHFFSNYKKTVHYIQEECRGDINFCF